MCRNLLNVIWRLNGLQRRQVWDLLKPTIPSLANRQDNIDEDDDIPFKCLSKHFRLHKIKFVEKKKKFPKFVFVSSQKVSKKGNRKKDAISVFVEILSGYDDKVVAVVIALAVLLLFLDCFAFQFVKGSVSCYPYHVIHPSIHPQRGRSFWRIECQ